MVGGGVEGTVACGRSEAQRMGGRCFSIPPLRRRRAAKGYVSIEGG